MPIPSSLSLAIDRRERLGGEAYFRQGRALVVGSGKEGIRVMVAGSRRHSVTLAVEDETLLCECDCTYFLEYVEPCKHVWASLLAADQKGSLGALTRVAFLEPIDPDPFEGLFDDEEDDFAAPEESISILARPAGADPPRARRRDRARAIWSETLELLEEARLSRGRALQGFEPGRRELLYLIDLATVHERKTLVVSLLRRDRLRDGSWGKPRPLTIGFGQGAALPDPADRRILGLLQGARPRYTAYYGRAFDRVDPMVEIPPAAADLLLREIGATGRCLVSAGPDTEPNPLVHDPGDPWRFRVDVRDDGATTGWVVTGRLERGGETMPLSQPDLLLAAGLVFTGGRVCRLDHGGAFPLLGLLRRVGRIEVPRAEGARFVHGLLAVDRRLAGDLPEELRFQEVRGVPKPRVRILRPAESWTPPRLQAAVTFDYDGRIVEAGSAGGLLFDAEARRVIIRDPAAEEAALVFLGEQGFTSRGWSPAREQVILELPSRRLAAAVPELLRAGWRVEAEGKLYRAATSFRIEVTSGIDWFELHGGATFDGVEVPMPALLAALKKGESAVLLGDGTLGLLPEEWLARYAPVAGLGEGKDDHIRFGRSQAGFLDALLAVEPVATCDELFDRVRGRLREFEGVRPAEAPEGFRGVLRPYQKEGLGWLLFLREFGFGGCLADDMGLGKTVQVLALLERLREERGRGEGAPSLVVAPRSVVLNWIEEARRFTPLLRVLDHTGLDRNRCANEILGHDIVLTTYGTMRRDIGILKEIPFETIVLDEAQAIKNARTQAARAVRLLRGAQRLALSGTPIENHLGELWSLFEFLNPGMLGTSSAFLLGARAAREPEGQARTLLSRALRPFILRRTKARVAPELPEKTEQTLSCELEGDQRRLYQEMLAHYRHGLLVRVGKEGIAKVRIQILEALLRLRQAACHPGLLDPKLARDGSAKFDVLFSQLDEVIEEGHKTLVFSQFTSLLALVKRELDHRGHRYAYLDGSMGAGARQEAIRRFQEDPGCPLFLLSLKAGGFGLNLTAAEYVYLLDPWWNPAVEAQAIDRTHRIGQTRPVFAYRIVAAGTIEEKIIALQASKRALADSILAADASVLRDLTREDLELLLS